MKLQLGILPAAGTAYVCEETRLTAELVGTSAQTGKTTRWPADAAAWRVDRVDGDATAHVPGNNPQGVGREALLRPHARGNVMVNAQITSTPLQATPAPFAIQKRMMTISPANLTVTEPGPASQFWPVIAVEGLCGGVATPCRVRLSSDNATVARIDEATGAVMPLMPGTAHILATLDKAAYFPAWAAGPVPDGCEPYSVSMTLRVNTPVVSVAITPARAILKVHEKLQLRATALDGAGKPITGLAADKWESNLPYTASLCVEGPLGCVIGNAPGTTTISATIGGVTGSAAVTVVPVVVIAPAAKTIKVGETGTFTAAVQDFYGQPLDIHIERWSVDNPTIASLRVSGPGGCVIGNAPGTTTLSATVDGISARATVTVRRRAKTVVLDPPLLTILPGQAFPFAIIARDESGKIVGTTADSWRIVSSPPGAIVTTPAGVVTALAPNAYASIVATFDEISANGPVHSIALELGTTGASVDCEAGYAYPHIDRSGSQTGPAAATCANADRVAGSYSSSSNANASAVFRPALRAAVSGGTGASGETYALAMAAAEIEGQFVVVQIKPVPVFPTPVHIPLRLNGTAQIAGHPSDARIAVLDLGPWGRYALIGRNDRDPVENVTIFPAALGGIYRLVLSAGCETESAPVLRAAACSADVAGGIGFDQATFDQNMGQSTFPLTQYFRIVLSPNVTGPAN